jgi:4-diphosphocytidyl-2-C-methyl-D-erythritol kinase
MMIKRCPKNLKEGLPMLEAPAKINLFLNVVGKRQDGYHLLESLFIPIPGLYDVIKVEAAQELSCVMEGCPAIPNNIALKVASQLKERFAIKPGAKITIIKKIPISAGLGGGSSDAAATLKLLLALWGITMSDSEQIEFAARVGADVPFFLKSNTAFIQGIGEIITPVKLNLNLPLLLVNPGVEVNTAKVFQEGFPQFTNKLKEIGTQTLIEQIYKGKNDLEANALKFAPQVGEVLDCLRALPNCQLARMSGSGATCFAIFTDLKSAISAQAQLPKNWWSHSEEVFL